MEERSCLIIREWTCCIKPILSVVEYRNEKKQKPNVTMVISRACNRLCTIIEDLNGIEYVIIIYTRKMYETFLRQYISVFSELW